MRPAIVRQKAISHKKPAKRVIPVRTGSRKENASAKQIPSLMFRPEWPDANAGRIV